VAGRVPAFSSEPAIDVSTAERWPTPVEYPSASPRSSTIVVPQAGTVVAPAPGVVVAPGTMVVVPGTVVVPIDPSPPLMCPAINASDPRQC
jgi:hypothetical protein